MKTIAQKRALRRFHCSGPCVFVEVSSDNEKNIKSLFCSTHIEANSPDNSLELERASEIALKLNAHDDLLDACNQMLAIMNGSSPRPTFEMIGDLETTVRNAIAKTKLEPCALP